MKLNRILTLCTLTALLVASATSLLAQDNNNNNGDRRQRGPGGPGGQGGQGGGWDPAQMQQRMLDRYQEQLGFTNDVEWDAVKPLVQKVTEAQMAARGSQMRGMFGGRNRGGNGGPGGMMPANPEYDALRKAIDDNAPAGQIKDLLAKHKASQKAKQAKLEEAQANLKAVLTPKQEAQAYLLSLVN